MESTKLSKISLIVCVAALLLGGCTGNITQIAETQRVIAPSFNPVDPTTENLMYEVFTETGLAWDEGQLESINASVAALKYEAKYIYSVINLAGEVPYYEKKASINRIINATNDLRREFDSRVQIAGAVTNIGKGYYELLIDKIQTAALTQKLNLAKDEAMINKKATADDLAGLQELYSTLAPLVKTAFKAGAAL